MSKKKVRSIVIYIVLAVGLMLIPVMAFSQSLFLGIGSTNDVFRWVFMFVMGASFTVIWWVIRRWITMLDKIIDEQKMNNQQTLTISREVAKIIKRQDKHTDFIYKHVACHKEYRVETNEYHP